MTDNKTTPFESTMAKLNNSVLYIENIDDEDFTHSYSGVPQTIKKGETLPFPFPVGELLAKHLAMKIIRKKADKDGLLHGSANTIRSLTLYTPQKMSIVMDKIVKKQVNKPVVPAQSEDQIIREKTANMQAEHSEEMQNIPTKKDGTKVTKRQIIDDLKKRGIKFNPRDSVENLSKMLIADEMKPPTE